MIVTCLGVLGELVEMVEDRMGDAGAVFYWCEVGEVGEHFELGVVEGFGYERC